MTPDLRDYIDQHLRVTGKLPSFREMVEHFDGRKLGVLLALGEISEYVRRLKKERE